MTLQKHLCDAGGGSKISIDLKFDLLPALPSGWRSGNASGLRARGGYTIDLEWRDGRLMHARIAGSNPTLPPLAVAGQPVETAQDMRIEIVTEPRKTRWKDNNRSDRQDT